MRGRLCRSNSCLRNSAVPKVNAQDDLLANQDNLLSTDKSTEIHGKSKLLFKSSRDRTERGFVDSDRYQNTKFPYTHGHI